MSLLEIYFVSAIAFTLGVSAFCSLLEAFILSLNPGEIEEFKRIHPQRGALLEKFKTGIDETSSAILTLNTIANTMGATIVGGIAQQLFGGTVNERLFVGITAAGMTLGILMLSEILPKNLGVIFRRPLRNYLVVPLQVVRISMKPLSKIAKGVVWAVVPKTAVAEKEDHEQEIINLAEKSAKEGGLTPDERNIISNAIELDEVPIGDIMTPRTVVTALDKEETVDGVQQRFKNIPFGRLPVYEEEIDNIVGLVRRRDILQASSDDLSTKTMGELMGEVTFTPVNASAADTLQMFLKKHHQFAVVVDEYGAMTGVVTMEDIVEQILGREIYEEGDMAVDMRELAKVRARRIQQRVG